MIKTILITGTSSGYGKATAEHFLAQGWNVLATMRRPDPSLFAQTDRLRVLPLDVTSPDGIASLLESVGPIDVLVNNAGLGGVGAFEAMPMPLIVEVYPALWSREFAMGDRTGDQHDAYSIAAKLSQADQDGTLDQMLQPRLSDQERVVAGVEGWILGVLGQRV